MDWRCLDNKLGEKICNKIIDNHYYKHRNDRDTLISYSSNQNIKFKKIPKSSSNRSNDISTSNINIDNFIHPSEIQSKRIVKHVLNSFQFLYYEDKFMLFLNCSIASGENVQKNL